MLKHTYELQTFIGHCSHQDNAQSESKFAELMAASARMDFGRLFLFNKQAKATKRGDFS